MSILAPPYGVPARTRTLTRTQNLTHRLVHNIQALIGCIISSPDAG